MYFRACPGKSGGSPRPYSLSMPSQAKPSKGSYNTNYFTSITIIAIFTPVLLQIFPLDKLLIEFIIMYSVTYYSFYNYVKFEVNIIDERTLKGRKPIEKCTFMYF